VHERYFAYGSNMNENVMGVLIPSSRFIGVARLPDYRLDFRRRSSRTGTGVADVYPSPGDSVWGTVYEVDAGGMELLDIKEGVGRAYEQVRAEVILHRGGEVRNDSGDPVQAVVYRVIKPEPHPIAPTDAYAGGLVTAALARGIPDAYIVELERTIAMARAADGDHPDRWSERRR
jgi:gamma-glutamylcyclotransferase (GGCT)/AIG2-like uncharacterized protein YtfP